MKLKKSIAFACYGIKNCFITEQNFRIHTLVAIVVVIFGFVCDISSPEWVAISFCIAFVITMEMVNTAVEKLCDVVHKDLHPDIKRIKDIAAGAVLVSAGLSLIIGLIIFLPKIITYFKPA